MLNHHPNIQCILLNDGYWVKNWFTFLFMNQYQFDSFSFFVLLALMQTSKIFVSSCYAVGSPAEQAKVFHIFSIFFDIFTCGVARRRSMDWKIVVVVLLLLICLMEMIIRFDWWLVMVICVKTTLEKEII